MERKRFDSLAEEFFVPYGDHIPFDLTLDEFMQDASTPPPFERAGEFERETAGLGNAAFVERVRAIYDRRRQDLAALTDADLERPSWTPTGPATYGRFLEIRVFDFWVHERDVTTPLARQTEDTGVAAEIALGEVAGSLGYIVGKKVGHPDVEIITDSTIFIQLACGRIDPQAAIDSGAIRWNGDARLGEQAARNLRFTM